MREVSFKECLQEIEIFKAPEEGKWEVSGFGVISGPFDTPQEALEYIINYGISATYFNDIN